MSVNSRNLFPAYPKLTWIEISAIDRGTVADSVANGNCSGSLHHWPDEGVSDPRHDDLKSRDRTHGHEEHSKEPRAHARGGSNYSIAHG